MNRQLSYRELGCADGAPVLLLHGLFGSGDNLLSVARPLADNYRLILPDLRNHGSSPHFDTMDYPSLAEDILKLMDAMDIQAPAILGHSMGGKVAMQLALVQPKRVSALVVADIAPVSYPANGHDGVLAGLMNLLQQPAQSRNEADKRLSAFVEDASVRQFLLKNLKKNETGMFGLKLNLEAIRKNYDQIRAAPQKSGRYDGPVLFIKGGDSDYIQEAHRSEVQVSFPLASMKIIAGTGHWLHSQKPAVFARIVYQFLSQHYSSSDI